VPLAQVVQGQCCTLHGDPPRRPEPWLCCINTPRIHPPYARLCPLAGHGAPLLLHVIQRTSVPVAARRF
jgi:hypothetical protein